MLEAVLLEPFDHILKRSINKHRQDTPIEA